MTAISGAYRLVRARALLQLAEEPFGFVSLAGCHVRAREVGHARRAAAGERDRFLELRDGLVGHLLLEVCLAQVIVREAEIRFHLDRLLALQDRFIVRVRQGQQLRQVGVDHERQRIDAFRLPHFHDRLVIPVQQREVPRIPVVSGGVAGIELDGATEFLSAGLEVPVEPIQAECQRVVSLAERRCPAPGPWSRRPSPSGGPLSASSPRTASRRAARRCRPALSTPGRSSHPRRSPDRNTRGRIFRPSAVRLFQKNRPLR